MEDLREIADKKLEPPDDVEHAASCPQHEDAVEEFECGGIGEHLCHRIDREINGCQKTNVCRCPASEGD